MAELSTIARPYAEALFASAQQAGSTALWLDALEELAALLRHPQVAQTVADPKLGREQVVQLLTGLVKARLPDDGGQSGHNFLQLLVDNDRLTALPEIARQFRALKNASEGVAECLIESAFAMSEAQLADLLQALSRRFGLRLKPELRVDATLIGGVRVTVGDQVLDSTVKTQLAQMSAALTAA